MAAAARQPAGTADDAPPGDWSPAPRHADWFAPAARRAEYRAFTTRRPLPDVLRELRESEEVLHPPGAWTAEALPARDAFGWSGPYSPWALATVYRGASVQVARGPRLLPDGTLESWTLVSPYPDDGLERLEGGTLLLVHRVPPL